jgi:hypothetical protein
MHEGRAVLVVAGYDRPLRELFLQILRCQENVLPGEDEIVYDRLDEYAIISIIGELAALVSH